MSADGWFDVFAYDELEQDVPEGVRVDGHYLALFRIGDGVYATSGTCSHAEADLCKGYVEGDTIECPLHQARFHIPTGKVLCEPAEVGIPVYPAEVRNGRVFVRLPGENGESLRRS
ncbi:MAG TPA: non-heme iron oxygenase ferredoxin subunit [Hyphomicrobiaceae bacterium]